MRYSTIAHLLQMEHVVAPVNVMSLIDAYHDSAIGTQRPQRDEAVCAHCDPRSLAAACSGGMSVTLLLEEHLESRAATYLQVLNGPPIQRRELFLLKRRNDFFNVRICYRKPFRKSRLSA